MKRISVVSLVIAVTSYGCTLRPTLAPPKYQITAVKQHDRVLNNRCNLILTFTNTRSYAGGLPIKILVLDEGNNTVTETNVIFNTTLPGKTNEQKTSVNANCNRVRRVAVTLNEHLVEPSIFSWPNLRESVRSVAIPSFKQFDHLAYGRDKLLAEVIRNTIFKDLTVSGLFDILGESLYLEDSQASGTSWGTFDFKNWSIIGAQVLVKGAFALRADLITVELRLYDVPAEREIIGKRYTASGNPAESERVGHKFADEIIFQLTGARGSFEAEYCLRRFSRICP